MVSTFLHPPPVPDAVPFADGGPFEIEGVSGTVRLVHRRRFFRYHARGRLDLGALGAQPRFGGSYAFEALGGTAGMLRIEGPVLPGALAVTTLEQQSRVPRAALSSVRRRGRTS